MGDLLVLVIVSLPFVASVLLLRAEPLRLGGLAGPAVR
jgi:hypothetical protein